MKLYLIKRIPTPCLSGMCNYLMKYRAQALRLTFLPPLWGGKVGLLLLFIFLFSTKGIAQYDCGSFEDCLDVGVSAYQDENYEGAVGYLTNAINKWKRANDFKNLFSAHMYRGNAYLEMDSTDQAIRDYNRIILINRVHAQASRMRAKAYEKKGEYSSALSDLTDVIKLENKADDYAERGILYGKIEKFYEAIKDLSKAIELNPEWVDYHIQLGQIYFLNKQYDKALEEGFKAQDLNAIIPDPYMLSAMAYMALKKFDQALEQAESAVNFAPDTKEVYEMRAMIYNKLGKHTEAIADLKKAIDLGSEKSRQDLKTIYKIDY